ncbi:hypothetical protein CH252_40610 [Rhodococcus sp. 06-1477-1B]|nr:hypothetical protein CH252_40610 [Rhodococcus sp. 06-1477-1B]
MSTLTTLRTDLADLLAEAIGFKGYGYLPASLRDRSVYVTPPVGTFIEPGPTFTSVTVNLQATVLLSGLNNQAGTEDANEAIEAAYVAAVNGGWTVTSADVEPIQSDGKTYLGVVLSLSNTATL